MFGNEEQKSILGCFDSFSKENKILIPSYILYTLTRNGFKTWRSKIDFGVYPFLFPDLLGEVSRQTCSHIKSLSCVLFPPGSKGEAILFP